MFYLINQWKAPTAAHIHRVVFSYLHAQAGLWASEWQNLDFDSLAFADNIRHIGHASLSAQLRNVDQTLPPLPKNGQVDLNTAE